MSESDHIGESTFNHSQTSVPKAVQEALGVTDGQKLLWFPHSKKGYVIVTVGVALPKLDVEKKDEAEKSKS